MGNFFSGDAASEQGTARMNFFDLANLLDNDGNLQNEMMVMSFAATLLATIPVLLGNEFDVNVGLRKKRDTRRLAGADTKTNDRITEDRLGQVLDTTRYQPQTPTSKKFFYLDKLINKKL